MYLQTMSSPTKALLLLFLLVSSSSIQVTVALATMAIDLGSEFMKIAIVKPGVPMEIALNVESQRKTAVAVGFRGSERVFGTPALNMAVKFPANAFLFIPLLVGKKIDSPQVLLFKERFPFHNIQADENGFVKFLIEGKTYTAEELLAMLLENARETAQKFAEFPVKDAVITVPTFFTQAERRAVMRSAHLIGLNVLQLMNDNAATALNFGIFRRKAFNATAQYYMFYDMGASSTTATIVAYQMARQRIAGMVEENPQLSIIGVGVDQTLGGTAFTYRLRDHLAKLFNEQNKAKADVRTNPRAMAKLYKEASRVLKVLSANKECFAQIEGLFEEKDFKAKVSRGDLETLCQELFDRVSGPVDRALEMAQIPLHVIKEVLLMGGGTRIPKVQSLLQKISQKSELGKGINTDEAAALGAVYQAAHHSPGFRVKPFIVKDSTYFPIKVDFERLKPGEKEKKQVTRTLFGLGKSYPHKMSITFNKHTEDFGFEVGYGLLNHLHPDEAKAVGSGALAKIHLKGVTAAHAKYAGKEGVEPKGVKARFQVDDSGLLALDHAEALFEKSVEAQKKEASEQSTLSKLGSTISNLFGGGTKEGEKEGEKKEEKKEEDKEKKAEEKEKEKKDKSGDNKTNAANETKKDDKKKQEDLKPVIVREPLTFTSLRRDMPEPTEASIAASMKLIDGLRERDLEKKKLERARNELESFIFETKDKLYQEEYEKCSTESERKRILDATQEASNWYEEQGEATGRKEYETRLDALKTSMKDMEFRVKEMKERPKVFSALKDLLNNTEFFHRSLANLTGEGKVFTQTEVDTLSKLINDTKDWLTAGEKEMAVEKCPANAATYSADAGRVRAQRVGANAAELLRLRFSRELALQRQKLEAAERRAAEAAKKKAAEAKRRAAEAAQRKARLQNLRRMQEKIRSPQERKLARLRRILAQRAAAKKRQARGPSAFLERDAATGAYRFSSAHRRRLRAFLRRQMLRAAAGRTLPLLLLPPLVLLPLFLCRIFCRIFESSKEGEALFLNARFVKLEKICEERIVTVGFHHISGVIALLGPYARTSVQCGVNSRFDRR